MIERGLSWAQDFPAGYEAFFCIVTFFPCAAQQRQSVAQRSTALLLAKSTARLESLLKETTPTMENVGKLMDTLRRDYRSLTAALGDSLRHLPLDDILPFSAGATPKLTV